MSKKPKKKPQFKVSRRTVVTTVIVIVVLVVAVGAGVLAQFLQRQAEQQSSKGIQGDANDFTIPGGSPLPKAVIDSQNLATQGKTDEANKKIADALSNNPGDETKYELYIQEGINYQNSSKYPEAMASYSKAEAIKSDYKIVKLIASVAEAMGDKSLATEYYRKAITLIDPESPLKDADKRRLEAKLRELGA